MVLDFTVVSLTTPENFLHGAPPRTPKNVINSFIAFVLFKTEGSQLMKLKPPQ